MPSATTLRGRYAIRVANVNHRTRREDFDTLVAAVKSLGQAIAAEGMQVGRRVVPPRTSEPRTRSPNAA